MQTQPKHKCERCGVSASDTPEGYLAFNGDRRVCADCNSDLDDEWVADAAPGEVRQHPLNALLHA